MQSRWRREIWYRLGWIAALAMGMLLLIWLTLHRTVQPVDPREVRSETEDQPAGPGTLDQTAAQIEELTAQMQELEIALSSRDGSLRMRVWAADASKDGERYTIKDGVLQFTMENQDTLILRVADGEYVQEAETAKVSGSLTGYIMGSQQYFTATGLTWNKTENVVRASKVMYRAPNVEIAGESMQLDLVTHEVLFEGAVEAGV